MPDKHSNSRREFLQKMIALTALAGVALMPMHSGSLSRISEKVSFLSGR
jgi:hypothetical protein